MAVQVETYMQKGKVEAANRLQEQIKLLEVKNFIVN